MTASETSTGVTRPADIADPRKRRRVALPPEIPALIHGVTPGGLADELGIRPGDRLVTVNGHRLRDVIDFAFYSDVEDVTLEVLQSDELVIFEVERGLDEPWGVEFADPTFDGIHVCDNSCPFCFIKQIPKGMRRSLYVMDDDYRYSMLYGSFVTLTNLTDDDWRRIEEQRLGPLYVSVHSTNPALRTALIGNPRGARIMEDLRRLEDIGIDYHAQLVLNPGINDGDELDRSLRDLESVGPHLKSIAGVPVGLTRFGQSRQSKRVRQSRICMRTLPGADLDVRRYRTDEAQAIIAQANAWQDRFRRTRGETFFYLGDEFYLMTGTPVPPTRHYDSFGQLEDGIGITRRFLDDALDMIAARKRRSAPAAPALIASGTLIGPIMRESVAAVNSSLGTRLEAVEVENRFFGPEITVSGLLTGGDVAATLAGRPGEEPVFISNHMISARTTTLLDDMPLDELRTRLRRDVIVAEHLSDVLRELEVKG
jgi:putative radical SAM enzyme (TIGR03279 family)